MYSNNLPTSVSSTNTMTYLMMSWIGWRHAQNKLGNTKMVIILFVRLRVEERDTDHRTTDNVLYPTEKPWPQFKNPNCKHNHTDVCYIIIFTSVWIYNEFEITLDTQWGNNGVSFPDSSMPVDQISSHMPPHLFTQLEAITHRVEKCLHYAIVNLDRLTC